MDNRTELIDDWRSRWAEIVRPHPEGENSLERWKRRSNRRLYHCLVSMYGHGHWNAAREQASDGPTPDVGASADIELNVLAQPKGLPTIRKVLKKVRSLVNTAPEVGPHVRGLSAGNWICVASISKKYELAYYTRWLDACRIPFRTETLVDGRAIYVPVRWNQKAVEILPRGKPRHKRWIVGTSGNDLVDALTIGTWSLARTILHTTRFTINSMVWRSRK